MNDESNSTIMITFSDLAARKQQLILHKPEFGRPKRIWLDGVQVPQHGELMLPTAMIASRDIDDEVDGAIQFENIVTGEKFWLSGRVRWEFIRMSSQPLATT